MYTAVSLRLVPNGINKRWMDTSVSYANVNVLFSNCRRVYIAAKILPDQTVRYLDLQQFAPTYSTYTGTVQQMLTAYGNAGAVEVTAPILDTRTVEFSDAVRAGYQLTPVHPTLGLNAGVDGRTDLLITRAHPKTDYAFFKRRAMVSVNGFYHMIDTDSVSGVHVRDGAKSLKISGQNQVGVLSFASLADLTYVPITAGMIKKRLTAAMIAGTAPEGPLSSIGYVKLGRDMTGKTAILVLGGYMFMPDSTALTRVSDDEFAINFQAIQLPHRYYESKRYMDLSSLSLSTGNNNPDQISLTELMSDAVLSKYLTLSQSFFVIVNSAELYVNRYYVKKTGTPGMYISYQKPTLPLYVGVGRMPEYWPRQEEDRWSLSAYDMYNRNKIFDTSDPLRLTSVSSTGLPMDPEYYASATLVEIGSDIR
jgi:hypothetical protein